MYTTHTAIANTRAHIDRRLARWILMAHDRTRNNTLPLTHEFLALMLGVRRSGVTEALQSLRKQKLIENGRNKIVVLNRKGIEKMAGNSYGVPEKEFGGSSVRIIVRAAASWSGVLQRRSSNLRLLNPMPGSCQRKTQSQIGPLGNFSA